MGFGAEIKNKAEFELEDVYSKVIAQDLVKFGLIPELVGRVPVITALQQLSKEDLIRILSEPKNALLKQFKALFNMDDTITCRHYYSNNTSSPYGLNDSSKSGRHFAGMFYPDAKQLVKSRSK